MRQPRLQRRRSVQLARDIDAQMKECYWNALLAVRTIPDLADAWYVEGIIVSRWPAPMTIEHGWVETRDGAILDPTLALRDSVAPRRVRWPLGLRYFPVARYTGEDASERAHATRMAPRWEDDAESLRAMLERKEAIAAELWVALAKRAGRA